MQIFSNHLSQDYLLLTKMQDGNENLIMTVPKNLTQGIVLSLSKAKSRGTSPEKTEGMDLKVK